MMQNQLNHRGGCTHRRISTLWLGVAAVALVGLVLAACDRDAQDNAEPNDAQTEEPVNHGPELVETPAEEPRTETTQPEHDDQTLISPTAPTESGVTDTPERRAIEELHTAAWEGDVDMIRVLLGRGVDIHGLNRDSVTPLHTAARGGRLESMRVLIAHGADVDFEGRLNITPLHWAVRGRQLEAARLLLESGADPNALAGVAPGVRPVTVASEQGNRDMVNLLVEYGGIP